MASDNSKIAKNTLMLYIRMIFMMGVTLYTSRAILNILGVEDYGIYNVVGGIVTMFGFLNGAMSTCTQRYITFALGSGDPIELKKVFSTCVLTHILIAIIVFILAETIGIWLLYTQMQIPVERQTAAFWVFQCAMMSTVVMILSVPYNADIVAHEQMSAFAYISIIEVVLKLGIVYILLLTPFDYLIAYAVLLLLVQCLIRYLYDRYCKKHFEEANFFFQFDKKLFIEMLSFSGWSLWGNLAAVLSSQGVNIILNMFFGPLVNAAQGISVQAKTAVIQFSINFQMAINPQITKNYARGETDEMFNLMFRSSKFTFYLLLILSTPIVMETFPILKLWLTIVPEWTTSFLQLSILIVIIDAIANPLMTAAAATGKVMIYQSVIGGILLLTLPISYVFLKLGGSPLSVFVTQLAISLFAFIVRLKIINSMLGFPVMKYLREVLYHITLVGILSFIPPYFTKSMLDTSAYSVFIVLSISVISPIIIAYCVGISSDERKFINGKIQKLLRIINK